MGLFSKMKDASYSQSGVYMAPNCNYTLELVSAITGEKKTTGDEYFVATFTVIDSDSEHKPGTEVSYFVGNSGASKMSFLGNVKKLVTALCGSLKGEHVNPSEVGEAEVLDLLEPATKTSAPGTMAAGTRVKCRTKAVKTKLGGDFTVHDFEPVFEVTQF